MHPYKTRSYTRNSGSVTAVRYPKSNFEGHAYRPLSVQHKNSVQTPVVQTDAKPDGHIVIGSNTRLDRNTKVIVLLGKGTFGKVFKCIHEKKLCAIKIIKNIKKYTDAAWHEIKVLDYIRKHDPDQLRHCIHLTNHFVHNGHVCMLFPLLDISLYDFMKANDYRPLPVRHIQSIAKQLFTAIEFLHSHNIIHTDLKPENLMLVNSSFSQCPLTKDRILKDTKLILIDFGSAIFEHEYHPQVVSTRHYRAPEIILELGWRKAIDMWSLGCIIVEFFTGHALFQTHDNLEHLAIIERVIGKIPYGCQNKDYFENGSLNYPNDSTTEDSIKHVFSCKDLETLWNIEQQRISIKNKALAQHGLEPSSQDQQLDLRLSDLLLDLCRRLFEFSPSTRLSAGEARWHEFLAN